MTSTLPAQSLADYTDEELRDFYGASTEPAWHAQIEAEMARRDEVQAAAVRRQAAHARYRTTGEAADWYEMAHAQYLAAEAACAGRLLSDEGMAATCQPMTLWTGTERWARRMASEELRNWWDDHNGRLTLTQYRQQAAASRRDAMEAHGNDQLDRDARGSVRRIASQGQGARARGDGRGDHVPGLAARGSAQDHAGAGAAARPGGFVRGGRVSETTQTNRERLAERARQIRAATAPGSPLRREEDAEQAGAVPSACKQPGAAVALRAGTAIVQAKPLISGDQTLRYIYGFLAHFACWGSEAELVAATLWIAQSHARDGNECPIWQYCARLAILGPSGSGKSWKSRLIGKLASKGEILVEPTKPAFIDLCAENHTVILTEADEAFRSPGRSRGIVAVANASYEPDRSSSRKQGGVAVKIPLFCHMVLDGIDDVLLSPNRPDLHALMSRCIILMARRAPEGYRPPRFDGQARAAAAALSQRAAAWMSQEVAAGMASDVPVVPEHLGNRPFALWEPLFIVALRADNGDPEGPWSQACAEACEQLEAAAGVPDETVDQASELDRQMAAYGFGEDEF